MALDYTHVVVAAPLVPLAEMKTHLRVTDTAHDADIAAIGAAAQDTILAYLTTAADPAWTTATAPRPVMHAIKIYAAHLYEHRGDDMAQVGGAAPDVKAWESIRELLGRHRDPTLA